LLTQVVDPQHLNNASRFSASLKWSNSAIVIS
jgi:hypothetical protein